MATCEHKTLFTFCDVCRDLLYDQCHHNQDMGTLDLEN